MSGALPREEELYWTGLIREGADATEGIHTRLSKGLHCDRGIGRQREIELGQNNVLEWVGGFPRKKYEAPYTSLKDVVEEEV
jgi:hypothetical protein